MKKQTKTSRTAKTTKAAEKTGTGKAENKEMLCSPRQAFRIGMNLGYLRGTQRANHDYVDGFNTGMRIQREKEDAQRATHVASDAEALPILRIVTDGERWAVEQRVERPTTHWRAELVRCGLFRSKPATIESRETRTFWRKLCFTEGLQNSHFTSREAAVEWVRREFGEAGIRSLKQNAEFRPA